MNKHLFSLTCALLVCATPSWAAVSLFEYGYNIDGGLTYDSAPAGVSHAGFDTTTGTGTSVVTITGVGAHYVGMFVDHEIDEDINGFTNETGAATGSPGAGETWEIDEPEYVFGDIITNFESMALDGTIGTVDPEDVSMALAWDFSLAAGEIAKITFVVSPTAPGGFHLTQADPDSDVVIHFSSSLSVIPEPSSSLLALVAGGFLLGFRRRR